MLCDVVEASIAHKIVKIDYIALQCKSLIKKKEINRDRVDRNGDTDEVWTISESEHTKWSLMSGSGDDIAYGVPHRNWSVETLKNSQQST